MKKDELDNLRIFKKESELKDLEFYQKFIKTDRERFDYADSSQWLLETKNESDLSLITDSLIDWLQKSKNDPQKKTLNGLIIAIFRIQSYCTVMETISKQSVAKMISFQKSLESLQSEKKRLELQHIIEIRSITLKLENAEKEIKFINGSSG